STPLALYFIAAWSHRRFYIRGYSRTQEGRHGKSLLMHLRDWWIKRSVKRTGTLEDRLAELERDTRRPFGALGQLIIKDRVIFTRDASQWSNILVIVSLMTIYLVNYKNFSAFSDIKLMGDVGLYFFNLAICGFVIMALSGRFFFPSISLEGRSFWMLLQAPISLERMLVGKWLGAMLPVVVVGQLMIWASNVLVLQTWFYMLAGCLLVLMMTLTIAALAVGFGAVYPQFHNPNAASIASSFGSVIFMLLSIFYMLLFLAGAFRVVSVVGAWFERGKAINLYWFDYAGLGFSVLLSVIVITVSIKLGATSLRRRL
ncbi:MAG: hypothetical protein KC492_38020, partial [Myxococcales bacterium]|nr:hypothetical protein [Myxococcales bacterium]